MKGKAGEEARCVSHPKVRGAHRPAGEEGSPIKLAFKRASLTVLERREWARCAPQSPSSEGQAEEGAR